MSRQFPDGAVPMAGMRHGGRLRAAACALMFTAVAGCSETSLNEAPVIDLSARPGARAKAPPVAPVAAPGEVLYTVGKGDTLFHVATLAHASVQDLARWNGIDEHAPIVVGQRLRLQAPPAAGDAPVQAPPADAAPAMAGNGDSAAPSEVVATPIAQGGAGGVETRTLDAVPPIPAGAAPVAATGMGGVPASGSAAAAAASPAPGAPAVEVAPAPAGPVASAPASTAAAAATAGASAAAAPGAAAAGMPADATQPSGGSAAASGWIWPVAGAVTGKFDPVRSKGIEIAAPEDAPIVAVADGTVSYTGKPPEYGNLVILKHSDQLLSVYAHAKTILVKEGQTVGRGQTIATAGKSPGAVPPTVHFEARRNHVAVDPLDLLPLR